MVKTGVPRGHGPGRAASPEAETERRAKIRAAALVRKEQVRVILIASYRLRGRSVGASGTRRDELGGWNYVVGRSYSTRVFRRELSDRSALEERLNASHPRRIHYNVRVAYVEG